MIGAVLSVALLIVYELLPANVACLSAVVAAKIVTLKARKRFLRAGADASTPMDIDVVPRAV
jgi:hypothetical protein